METELEYDLLNYPGLVFSNTSPAHLACRAASHGIEFTRPDKCRVLELGCAKGTNLLAHAYSFPQSEFHGFDLSASHIAAAKAASARIGVSNAFFRQMNILDLDEKELGKFDYIVAHGVYSWVPDEVRRKILSLYKACLAEDGIGYISFNAYPGCHGREILWNAIRFFTKDSGDIEEKLQRSIAVAQSIEASIDDRVRYKPVFSREVESLLDKPLPFVLHDDLSPALQPFYFHEFAGHLEESGLQFLCEADPLTSFTGNLNESGQEFVASMDGDLVAREQAIDFIRGRQFRRSLVCHKSVTVDRSFPADLLEKFHLSVHLAPLPEGSDLNDDSSVDFRNRLGSTITTDEPLLKNMLAMLGREWPGQFTFEEVINRLRDVPELQANFDGELRRLKDSLIPIYAIDFLKLSVHPTPFCENLPERPKCSSFARFQIEEGSPGICALDGIVHSADDALLRQVILCTNGERDRDEIIAAVRQNAGMFEENDDSLREQLPERVDAVLEYLRLERFLLPDEKH